jgi:hypothetical protein
MLGKIVILILVANFAALASAQGTTCTFDFMGNDYTCQLVNQTISRSEDMVTIGGVHMESFGNINVQRVDQEFSVVEVFPTELIDEFVNLRTLYLRGTRMRFWTTPIKNCARLTEIDLNMNQFASIDPNFFAECNRLSSLSMNQNRIRTITDNAFVGLSSLDTLSLSNNIIRTITNTSFRPIGNLAHLILDNNQVVEFTYESLSAIPNLRTLSLRNNAITTWDVHILRFNPRLERLFLSGNQLKTLEPNTFSNLQNLNELWLGNLMEEVPVFESVGALEILVLNDNQLMNISSLSFANMRNLKSLHLDRNQLGSFDFSVTSPGVLSNLENLFLNNNSIGWLEDCSLEALTSLKHLEMSFNEFRRIPYDYIQPSLPLEFLDITRNRVSQIDRRVIEESPNIYLMAKDNACVNGNFLVNATFDMGDLQDCFGGGMSLKVNVFVVVLAFVVGLVGKM